MDNFSPTYDMGKAAGIRNGKGASALGSHTKIQMHQVVHRRDEYGQFANKTNPYRGKENDYAAHLAVKRAEDKINEHQ